MHTIADRQSYPGLTFYTIQSHLLKTGHLYRCIIRKQLRSLITNRICDHFSRQ